MVRGDAFEAEELNNLFTHPVIVRHLEKLVLSPGKDTVSGKMVH
ncbi:hypothetical protein [Chitinophaga pinensis]|nr:hypothetical protein [Chitinophaga pinensis]